MASISIPAAELRTGDLIRLSYDTGVRVHRITRSGDIVFAWGQADPRMTGDVERAIGTYAGDQRVRLHRRDVAALTS